MKKKLILGAGREKSLLRRHPWIFSGAVARVEGQPQSGDTIELRSAHGEFLGWASYNPHSQITARVWSWHEDQPVNADLFRIKITAALACRKALVSGVSTTRNVIHSMRLIHGESDGLPGLIVDQYGPVLVMQISSSGADRWRDVCTEILQELCSPVCIYERSDSDSRLREGLLVCNGLLRGRLPESVTIEEQGLYFAVDVVQGQKNGFYLDQRENRAAAVAYARGRLLDCFSYNGGFALQLGRSCPEIIAVDISDEALARTEANAW